MGPVGAGAHDLRQGPGASTAPDRKVIRSCVYLPGSHLAVLSVPMASSSARICTASAHGASPTIDRGRDAFPTPDEARSGRWSCSPRPPDMPLS